jgi:hypothetical protein
MGAFQIIECKFGGSIGFLQTKTPSFMPVLAKKVLNRYHLYNIYRLFVVKEKELKTKNRTQSAASCNLSHFVALCLS